MFTNLFLHCKIIQAENWTCRFFASCRATGSFSVVEVDWRAAQRAARGIDLEMIKLSSEQVWLHKDSTVQISAEILIRGSVTVTFPRIKERVIC